VPKDPDQSVSTFRILQARCTTVTSKTAGCNTLLFALYQNSVFVLPVLHFALLVRTQVHLDAEPFLQTAFQQNAILDRAERLAKEALLRAQSELP